MTAWSSWPPRRCSDIKSQPHGCSKCCSISARRSGGDAFVAPLDIVLTEYDIVQPDLMYFSADRLALLRLDDHPRVAPDLVVEILSPATGRFDRGYKLELYAMHGVREYWLVDPRQCTIEEMTYGDREGRVAGCWRNGTVISPTFPGLSLDLAQLFRGL
jgi:Uma2 family endonuclease